MKKLIIVSVILVIFSTIGFADASTESNNFCDVPGNHWAKDFIYELKGKSIVEGNGHGVFDPDGNLTVAAALKMVIVGNTKTEHMPRTQGKWYTPYIEVAYEMKLIKDGEFNNFERYITRNEMARILVRGTGLEPSPIATSFSDDDSIPEDFKGYVKTAVDLGYISGYESDNTFRGDNLLTRAENCKLISKNIDYLESVKAEDTPVIDTTELDALKKKMEEEGNPVPEFKEVGEDAEKIELPETVVTETPEFHPSQITLSQADYDRLYSYPINPYDDGKEYTFAQENKMTMESDYVSAYYYTQRYMFNHLNNIFTRDYEKQSDDEYYSEVEKYYGNQYNNGYESFTPTEYVNYWVEDTYNNKVKADYVFLNDTKLFSAYKGMAMYRGVLYFKYTSHEKPKEIYRDLELQEFKNFELNKWYKVDADIVMIEAGAEKEVRHIDLNTAKFYLFTIQSEFEEVGNK